MTGLVAAYIIVAASMLAIGALDYLWPDSAKRKRVAARLLVAGPVWPVWLLVLAWLTLKLLWAMLTRGLPALWKDAFG